MSRVGKVPIAVPAGVQVTIEGNNVSVKGPRGQLSRALHPDMSVTMEDNVITVTRPSDGSFHRSLHGLTRSLVANMITGVSSGFEKSLEIRGVGYRGQVTGRNLILQLGYSHPIEIVPPPDISVSVEASRVTVHGIDKQAVGEMAAKIRELRTAEPYQGKGIRYLGERVRRKAGKSGKAAERG
ncbi:MAG: 50S ribosomal protein L6 [Chloroflexi bacterium]|nr:50S ribosomal protein L6 [Chloroflexota bacterium]